MFTNEEDDSYSAAVTRKFWLALVIAICTFSVMVAITTASIGTRHDKDTISSVSGCEPTNLYVKLAPGKASRAMRVYQCEEVQ